MDVQYAITVVICSWHDESFVLLNSFLLILESDVEDVLAVKALLLILSQKMIVAH